jgi:hypothetical protein
MDDGVSERRDRSLAASDLARRSRARDEAARRLRFPGLVRLGLGGSCGSRWFGFGRPGGGFGGGLGPSGSGFRLVLFETAVFVFAAGAAMTRLVASR